MSMLDYNITTLNIIWKHLFYFDFYLNFWIPVGSVVQWCWYICNRKIVSSSVISALDKVLMRFLTLFSISHSGGVNVSTIYKKRSTNKWIEFKTI